MKIVQTLIMVSLAAGLSQIANADDTSDMGRMHSMHDYMMKDADTNNDGAISRDEFMTNHKTRSEKMFTKLDTNNDSALSRDEFTTTHQTRAEKMFKKLDTNNDGKIDQTERKAKRGMMHKNCMMDEDDKTESDKK